MRPRAITLGLYCAGNLGDDLLMFAAAEALEERGFDVTVAVRSANVAASLTRRPVVPAPAVSRTMPGNVAAFLHGLRRADALVLGGGGLLQDTHYSYTVATYVFPLAAAVGLGRNAILWGVGAGPFRRVWNRWLARVGAALADVVTLRDPDSIAALGLPANAVRVVEDAAWGARLPASVPAPHQGRRIGLVLRDWPGFDASGLVEVVAGIAQREGAEVLLIPFEYSTENPRDWALAERARDRLVVKGSKASIPLPSAYPALDATLAAMRSCDVVLSMRFHGLILGIREGIPVCGVECAPKIGDLMRSAGLGDRLVSVSEAAGAAMASCLVRALQDPEGARAVQESARRDLTANAARGQPESAELLGMTRPGLTRRLAAAVIATFCMGVMVLAAVRLGVARALRRGR